MKPEYRDHTWDWTAPEDINTDILGDDTAMRRSGSLQIFWSLDPQPVVDDIMATNPGRIKEIFISQIIYAAGRFAKLRFPNAGLGLDQHFIN